MKAIEIQQLLLMLVLPVSYGYHNFAPISIQVLFHVDSIESRCFNFLVKSDSHSRCNEAKSKKFFRLYSILVVDELSRRKKNSSP